MPELDAIVPTIPGREASLERLLESLERTTESDLSTIIVQNSETCGKGWKRGLDESEAPYVLLTCDDQEFLKPGWDLVAIETVEEGLIPCPRVWEPDGRIQSQGGDMSEFQNIITRPQKDRTPVDYVTVPFLSREMIEAIGMVETHYASDVWVSYRGRQLGWETVLRHGFDVRHWREDVGRGAGLSEMERNEMDVKTVMEELERWKAWV
jgi:hypothetical protein